MGRCCSAANRRRCRLSCSADPAAVPISPSSPPGPARRCPGTGRMPAHASHMQLPTLTGGLAAATQGFGKPACSTVCSNAATPAGAVHAAGASNGPCSGPRKDPNP